jgi:Kae1-associated kinase Bud32
LEFCRHIAGSAQINAIGLLSKYILGKVKPKAVLEIVLVIRDFHPRLMSYVRNFDGTPVVFFAIDQWIFERDVDRGFLGEALAGSLIFPYKSLCGEDYLQKQETLLKKRLILELIANLSLSFPELSYSLHIKPEYFMYEVFLNMVRVFPPIAYGLSNLFGNHTRKKEVESVLKGYMKALGQLEKEERIAHKNGYVTISDKTILKSQEPKARFRNITKNAPRTLFASLFETFPQILNFLSLSTEALVKLQKLHPKRDLDMRPSLVNPQELLFVPTAKGLVSLADSVDIKSFVRKKIFIGRDSKIKWEPVGGVLNDVYLIRAFSNDAERKVLVKRFKDWTGFKWFPLSLWSFGTRKFAVSGRARLDRECAIGEFLRSKGINVPKILQLSPKEGLIFMEYIQGDEISKLIKDIAVKPLGTNQKNLSRISKVGEIYAKVHSFNITLGDTKPENVIVDSNEKIYLLDFEQATHGGDKAWDIAVFLYYSGHYLQPLNSNGKAVSIAKEFIRGYLKGGGCINNVKKAGSSKYTRIFSVFTMPSIMLAMSNVCKKTGK